MHITFRDFQIESISNVLVALINKVLVYNLAFISIYSVMQSDKIGSYSKQKPWVMVSNTHHGRTPGWKKKFQKCNKN